MFSWFLEQAMGPLSAQLGGSTLLLSLNIYSSKNLLSGPKKCMLWSVKTYVNKACQTLEKTLRPVTQQVWGSLEVFWQESNIVSCLGSKCGGGIQVGKILEAGSPVVLLRDP